jgi:isoaspartyl peptidase/L-asparaginase-like protein (Ntn-hydrolase superfamily)
MPAPTIVATWPFGQTAVRVGLPRLRQGESALDAAVAGAQAVEDDPAVHSVGYGGLPNSIGTVQLDASVMDGRTLSSGAIAALENVRHPAALARRVMERSPHIFLVGEGARIFAVQQGFTLECLSTPESLTEWQKIHAKRKGAGARGQGAGARRQGTGGRGSEVKVLPQSAAERRTRKKYPAADHSPLTTHHSAADHDTVTVLALDQKGNLGGVCSTSGLADKQPGRVGDSPIIGAGLYVDNSAGAAGATGIGEEIIRICGSFTIVEAMRAGRSPQEACELAVRKINTVATRRGVHPAMAAFIALDTKGRTGAACTARTNFQYAVGSGDKIELSKAIEIAP